MSVVGIDLGTTNTVVACVKNGRVHVLADDTGRRLLPSVVSFHPNGEVLVGQAAKERRTVDARNTIASVKRLIGRSWRSEEITKARTRFAFEMKEGPGHGPLVVARGNEYTLPEISAFVLRKAKMIAEKALGEPVERAVITVPANFNELQRASTKVAGRVAGLEVLRILNEPTAAALAYGLGRGGHERIAIYDFGGGTFDCTLLDLSGNVFEVLATAGDSFLGGDDIDGVIAERMADAFLLQHRFDPREDPQAFERLRVLAEQVKMELSAQQSARIHLREVAYGAHGAHLDITFGLSRAELETLAEPFIERTFKVCQDALALAGLSVGSFDKVILVGGSTRIPSVRRRVEEFFGATPLDRVNPDEVVGIGAAIQAAALTDVARRRSIPPPPTGQPVGRTTLRGITDPGVPTADQVLARVNLKSTARMPEAPGPHSTARMPSRPPLPSDNQALPPLASPFGISRRASDPGDDNSPTEVRRAPASPPPLPLTAIVDSYSRLPATQPAATSLPRPSADDTAPNPAASKPNDPDATDAQAPPLFDLISLHGESTETRPGGDEPTLSAPKLTAPLIARSRFEDLELPEPPRELAAATVNPSPLARSLEFAAPPPKLTPSAPPPATAIPAIPPPLPVFRTQPLPATAPPAQAQALAPPIAARPTPPPPAAPPPSAPPPMFPRTPVPPPFTATQQMMPPPQLPGPLPGAQAWAPALAPPTPPPPALAPRSSPPTGAPRSLPPPPPAPAQGLTLPPGPTPLLLDVTPRALVVETVGGFCDTIVPRNAKIPCERTRAFATGSDQQTVVSIRVAQGEAERFNENVYLGELQLAGLRAAPRGMVSVAVTFSVDANGTLQVRASDIATGRDARATLQLVGIAQEEMIAQMAQRASMQGMTSRSN